MLCHADFTWAEGGFVGLDIFFVLSGFLITGLLIGEHRKRGSISIKNFYARRAKRLLPLASTVLLVILIMSLILFTTVRQIETAGDVIAAVLYFVNWRFIAQGVDYFAVQEGLVSPVQHYWSLSVEEQFYVVWPLLMLGCGMLAAKWARNLKLVAFCVIVPLALISLAYSIQFTEADPRAGYFSTLTRVWELATGAILALVLPRGLRISPLLANLLIFGGIAAILASGYIFSEIDPYPGWRALFPVLGTAAVIVGGTAVARTMAARFLALAPFQYLGKVSYAWYLWHWPFIVFALAIFGELDPFQLTLVTLAAWIPTEITHRLIEEPFRRSKYLNFHPRKALAIGATFSLAVLFSAFALKTDRINLDEAPESRVAGAMAINGEVPVQEAADEVLPHPTKARDDKGEAHKAGCLIVGPIYESPECRFDKGEESSKRVVVYGDSHALQYTPTLLQIARQRGWNITVLTRGNCLPADTEFRYNCDQWRKNALKRIEEVEKPDLTVVSSSTLDVYRLERDGELLSRNDSQPLLAQAMAQTLKRLQRASGKVVLIRDQPRSPFLPFDCVADHPKDLRRCAFEPQRLHGWAFDYEGAKMAGVPVIDPMPVLCRENICPSVIGNALVYRDTYHITATYARTLANWLLDEINRAGQVASRTRVSEEPQGTS